MTAPTRDTQWGPTKAWIEAAREAAQAAEKAGFEVELHEPNLPTYAEPDEAKRLAKKAKEEGAEREWRGDPYLFLKDPGRIADLCRFFRDDLEYQQAIDVTAVDYDAEHHELWGVYSLLSLTKKWRLTVKIHIPKSHCRVPSVTPVYPAADWHERESAEFFGITYEGHPDPRHMLLPDDWVGYPLRKDYEFPEEYHGISCV